jgi:hypothetical protein
MKSTFTVLLLRRLLTRKNHVGRSNQRTQYP